MKDEEIELTVEDNTLTLSSERSPTRSNAGKVSAHYKAGVLTVRLPLREEAKPKRITVGSSGRD